MGNAREDAVRKDPIVGDLKKHEQQGGHRVVSFPPKRLEPAKGAA